METATKEQKKILMSSIQEKGISEHDFNLLRYEHCCGASECLISKAWGLPKKFSDLVLCVNHLKKVSEKSKKLAYLIYLAEIVQHYKTGEIQFYQIDETVLQELNIESEEKLRLIISKLEQSI